MIQIRAAQLSDAKPIAALITQLGYSTDEGQMHGRLFSLIDKIDRETFVALDEGVVVGMIGLNISPYYEKDGLYGRIVVLVVDKNARGKSIGKKLLLQAEQWMRANHALDGVVNSGFHRLDAHEFYEKNGYIKTGFRFVKNFGSTENS